MRFVSCVVVFACLCHCLASTAQSPDSKELHENKGNLDGFNVYTNPILKLKLALPGEWHFFDRQMYSSPEAKQREKEMMERSRATCQGPLCGPSEVDVALQSLNVLPPPLYAVYLTAYPLSEEYQNRQRHPLKTFAEIMTIGSVRDQQWIAEGDLATIQLDGHPAYRIIMHDRNTPTAKAFAYVADSNGRIFMLLAVATSRADKLQVAIEKMQLSYASPVSSVSCYYTPLPVMTVEAMKARFIGSVRIEAVVSVEGKMEKVRILESPGLGLNESIVQTLKTWKCRPAIGPDGKPMETSVPFSIKFNIY